MIKLDGKTPDLAVENIGPLRQIFPDVFEEVIPAGHKINKILPIFKKIEPEEIKAYREKFGGKSN